MNTAMEDGRAGASGVFGGARRALAIVLALYTLCGVVLAALHLADVPRYGDSHEYLKRAESLEIDPYRGIAYPALLAGIDRVVDEEPLVEAWRRRWVQPDAPRTGMGGFLLLQVVQYAALAGALAYFLRHVGGRGLPRAQRLALGALVLVDPLVSHFQQAVLTDGLTLSACLVFCAALADLWLAPRVHRSSAALLAVSFLAAANLRVEKATVLAGTAVLSMMLLALLERRRPAPARRALPWGRVALVLGTLALCLGAGKMVQRRFESTGERWPVRESILDQRVVFPHLHEVYEELPEDVRSRLTPAEAREHVRGIREARAVIDAVTDKDPSRRTALIEACARVVLRERWDAVALDVAKDALENVAATLSFAVRIAAYLLLAPEAFERRFPDDWASWTWERGLMVNHPRAASGFAALTAVTLALAAVAAMAAARIARRGAHPDEGVQEELAAWIPVAVFVGVNALAFAAVQDLVHLRYTVLAHAVFLVLVYRGALTWISGTSKAPRLSAGAAGSQSRLHSPSAVCPGLPGNRPGES
jgi:hypothetical protein